MGFAKKRRVYLQYMWVGSVGGGLCVCVWVGVLVGG
jgi:hypothetical protein